MKFIEKFLASKGYVKRDAIAPQTTPVEKKEVIHKGGYSCEERLQQIVEIGESFDIVYDCGAVIGRWAQKVNEILPDAKMVLIEPNPQLHKEIGERTEPFKDQVRLIPSAVGSEDGTAELNVWKNSKHSNSTTALAGSSLLGHVQGEPSEKHTVDVTTLDKIYKTTNWKPDLIKMDLQGFEKDALLGAKELLNDAKVVISEFGCLEAYENRTKPQELFDILVPYGFLLYDIVDLRYRPYDKALAGGDFIFVKKDSQLWAHKDYF
jgi:FkbM family methyltransferase